ncbi:MAG: hypothetical protein EXR28_03760 [Betaproteobacteria bacterium]|nr:hypothetical protein [Betaproteobacteria bacterium]
MRPHNDNNAYILGAGFSAEAGLPVISSFLTRMRDAVDWLDKAGRVAEREAIERVLDFRHESAAAGYRINIDLDNIEHLFSLADAKPGTTSSDDIRLAIAATIDFAAQMGRVPIGRLRVSQANGWPCTASWRSSAVRWNDGGDPGFSDVESSIYDYYAATLSGLTSAKRESGKNTVITLNYDVVVEEALRRLDVPISYQLGGDGVEFDSAAGIDESAADGLQILKLHGSVNWAQKPDGSVLVCRDYEHVRTLTLAPLLVPPTWQKIAADALLRVWDAAVRAIARATRIVLIGFSIPPADQHFKYLLSVGLKDNSSLRLIQIIDPRASALRHQYEAVFREDQFKYGIAAIREQRTADFLYDPRELIALGRPPVHAGLALVAGPGGRIMERRQFL